MPSVNGLPSGALAINGQSTDCMAIEAIADAGMQQYIELQAADLPPEGDVGHTQIGQIFNGTSRHVIDRFTPSMRSAQR